MMASKQANGTMGRRHVTRRTALNLAAIGGGAAWLAACGSDSKETSSGSSGVSVATQGAGQAAGEPLPPQGGNYRFTNWKDDLVTFDARTGSYQTHLHASYIYSRIFKTATSPTDPTHFGNYEVEGDLAQKWEMADEGRTLIVQLRPEAKWQNLPPLNGRPFTADDVVYNVGLYKAETATFRQYITRLEGAEAIDQRTVKFKIDGPYAATFDLLMNALNIWFLPREIIEADGNMEKRQIGTGPFLFEKYNSGSVNSYKRNPEYWVQGQPGADTAEMFYIKDAQTVKASLRTGDLDSIYRFDLTVKDAPEIKDIPGLSIYQHPYMANQIINFPRAAAQGQGPWADERVRQAVQVGFDRKGIAQLLWKGAGAWGCVVSPMMWPNWGLPDTDPVIKEFVDYDARKAKQLLSAAGHANGMKVGSFAYYPPYGVLHDAAVPTGANLKESGVELRMEPLEASKLTEYGREGNFDGIYIRGEGPQFDPDNMLRNAFSTAQTTRTSPWRDEEANMLYEKQARTLDLNQRKAIVQDLLRLAIRKAYYPPFPVADAVGAYQRWVRNYQHASTYGYGTETIAKVRLASRR